MQPIPTRFILGVLLATGLAVGCNRDEGITFYQAPKEAAPTTAPAPQVAAAPAPDAPLAWKVPAGWKQQQSSQQMRFATFVVNEGPPPVEFTVIPLGPEAGELLPNLNRWENQLNLPASSQEQADKIVKHEEINGLHADVIDLASPESVKPRQRMLAAIIPYSGRTWFFKLVGPEPIVSAQKQNFDAFIQSLSPGAAAPEQDAQAQARSPEDMSSVIKPTSNTTIGKFTAPQDWRQLPTAAPPRVLAFDIGPENNKAELVITKFARDNAGPFLDNVNRWRNQIGLAPISDVNQVAMEDADVGATNRGVLLDFQNPDAKPAKRMLVCLASQANELWFFKLTGPSDLVTRQKRPFVDFLKSLEFTH